MTADPAVDLAAHRARYAGVLSAADPLLPEPAELAPGDGRRLLTARVGDSVAAGVARVEHVHPATLNATWGALDNHVLTAQVTGPDPAGALDALLECWDEHLAGTAGKHDDCRAVITVPSRYTAQTRALTRHGFGPVTAVAARTTPDLAGGPPTDGVTVRPLQHDDLDQAVPLYHQVITFDAQFGGVTDRPSTLAQLRILLVDALGRDRTCAWVAERDGRLLGLCQLDLPEHAAWIASMSRQQPASYLGCLVVDAGTRGAGIGSALAADAHRAAAAAGSPVTLLHHSVPNPLSMPFWYRHGYRPLWTSWQRRPAIR